MRRKPVREGDIVRLRKGIWAYEVEGYKHTPQAEVIGVWKNGPGSYGVHVSPNLDYFGLWNDRDLVIVRRARRKK